MRLSPAVFAAILLAACSPNVPEPIEPEPPGSLSDAVIDDADAEGAVGYTDDGSAPPDHVSIPAGETGGMCGGIAGFQCLNEVDYCQMAEGECIQIADVAGTCTAKPEACTKEYDPVCGCDGKTYGNSCTAAAEGVSVASRGECPATE